MQSKIRSRTVDEVCSLSLSSHLLSFNLRSAMYLSPLRFLPLRPLPRLCIPILSRPPLLSLSAFRRSPLLSLTAFRWSVFVVSLSSALAICLFYVSLSLFSALPCFHPVICISPLSLFSLYTYLSPSLLFDESLFISPSHLSFGFYPPPPPPRSLSVFFNRVSLSHPPSVYAHIHWIWQRRSL